MWLRKGAEEQGESRQARVAQDPQNLVYAASTVGLSTASAPLHLNGYSPLLFGVVVANPPLLEPRIGLVRRVDPVDLPLEVVVPPPCPEDLAVPLLKRSLLTGSTEHHLEIGVSCRFVFRRP